nr:hypothetical protein [uncultured Flavobacterium sp.]
MKYLFYIVIALAVTSCSALQVEVSTANPEKLKEIHKKIDVMEKMAFDYKRALQPLQNTAIITEKASIISQFKSNMPKWLEGQRNPENEKMMMQSLIENYERKVNDILKDYSDANSRIIDKKYKEAVDIYLGLEQKFQNLQDGLNAIEALDDRQKGAYILEIENMLKAVKPLFFHGRANLLGDNMISYIDLDNAKDMWESTYNRTVSKTVFGNSDIAVVLNEMPNSYNNNYSIKGVRVDAARLIQSSFDAMSQVINVAASMYGVRPAGSSDANSSYPDELTEVKNLPADKLQLENKKKLQREVQKQLLLKILGENIKHENDDELKKSVINIEAFWSEYKLKLN